MGWYLANEGWQSDDDGWSMPASGGAGGSVTITNTASPPVATIGFASATHAFTSVAIGSPTAGDFIVVMVNNQNSSTTGILSVAANSGAVSGTKVISSDANDQTSFGLYPD